MVLFSFHKSISTKAQAYIFYLITDEVFIELRIKLIRISQVTRFVPSDLFASVLIAFSIKLLDRVIVLQHSKKCGISDGELSVQRSDPQVPLHQCRCLKPRLE